MPATAREAPARLGTALALALCAAGATALGGCGSQTTTVTVASTPSSSAATSQSTTRTSTTAPPAPQQSTAATAAPQSATRTATEPAFTEPEKHGSEEAEAAAAVVRAHGYTPTDLADYHSDQTLRVLLGTRTGSADGHGQQAFFFIDGRYIGTDTKEPSATLRIVSQSDTAVAVAYALYRSGDPLCCPSGGQATVRYELDNGKLVPLGTIPPVQSASGLSRH